MAVSERHRTMSSSLQEIIYKPSRDGLERFLGPLEARVMEYLWSAGEPCTSMHITDVLTGGRSYSTVMTTLTRLVDKGLLRREPEADRRTNGLVFSPTVNNEEFYRVAVRSILDGILDDCPDIFEAELQRIYGRERFHE